jgi:hypothetical protein
MSKRKIRRPRRSYSRQWLQRRQKLLEVLPYHYQYRRRPLLLLEPALSLLSWMLLCIALIMEPEASGGTGARAATITWQPGATPPGT